MALFRTVLEDVLSRLAGFSILVVGDYFLDEYLFLDPALSETSLETGLEAYQVVSRRRQPGAAGTVINNLAELGVGRLAALGLCGEDGEGWELLRALRGQGVQTSFVQRSDLFTPTYCKPMRLHPGGPAEELNRLDSKNRAPISPECEKDLITRLRSAIPDVQAVIVADQVQESGCGAITSKVRDALSGLAVDNPGVLFFADSRVRIGQFSNLMVKPNQHELAALFSLDPPVSGAFGCEEAPPDGELLPLEELAAMGQELSRRTGQPVFATCGDRGVLVCTVLETTRIPSVRVPDPVDVVGAGDSATAGIVCGLLGGLNPVEAATLGCLVASITVQKLGTTGTASPEALLARLEEASPGLEPVPIAPEWQRRRRIGQGIEIIRASDPAPVRAALFDFDGTLSLIREGWQEVMIPFMVEELASLETGESREALQALVREFVFRLTGKQTIYQMIRLAEEIRKRGGEALDPLDYKDRYHERLWQRIQGRVAGLKDGTLEREEMLVPGSLELLEVLRSTGARLFLASGTDLGYVQDEVEALGLREYFGAEIYGALPRHEDFSKKQIIDQILREHSLSGPELVVIGDGYVEIENAREVGGRAVGAATDERRPGRIDSWKRNRLIAAGADIIVPDFSEAASLVGWLTRGTA